MPACNGYLLGVVSRKHWIRSRLDATARALTSPCVAVWRKRSRRLQAALLSSRTTATSWIGEKEENGQIWTRELEEEV
jgi:hypothetical protein